MANENQVKIPKKEANDDLGFIKTEFSFIDTHNPPVKSYDVRLQSIHRIKLSLKLKT